MFPYKLGRREQSLESHSVALEGRISGLAITWI
jgi:hypothetical protein